MEPDRLVGLSEIAEMAEPQVSRQAVANWRKRFDDFPQPVQTLSSGPVWKREVVEDWLGRRSGRSPTVISFINLKGGVGKTTTSVGVAEVLAMDYRKHVLFIDLDPQTNATINLIGEERWKDRDDAGQTLAHLFLDKIEAGRPPRFDIEQAVVKGVSAVNGGIPRLDLLPSSIEFIEIQEKLPFVAIQGNYEVNPQNILREALKSVIDRYDYVIIDCPPSLGLVTKNGLRMSSHYVIPTIPDIVSTWGIFQIVRSVSRFADDINASIDPAGIIATKVQATQLHDRVLADLRNRRLFSGKETDLEQPVLFGNLIRQRTQTAGGADNDAGPFTINQKYGAENVTQLRGITKELMQKCSARKS